MGKTPVVEDVLVVLDAPCRHSPAIQTTDEFDDD